MIHDFVQNGLRFVLDVNSGSVHLVDELSWLLLSCHPDREKAQQKACAAGFHQEEIEGAQGEIDELIKDGSLFSPDFDMEAYLSAERPLRALCLHLAHDCNLRCRYCFGQQGNYGGEIRLMPFAVGQKAMDFLFSRSGFNGEVEVDFFGGEPLLNFDVLRRLVIYGEEKADGAGKKINFTVTTNAVLLNDEVDDFLNRHAVQVILSLDGRPGVNDDMRPFAGGSGSYRIVAPNIKRFIEKRALSGQENYHVRGTFTRHNLDFSADFVHLAQMGCRFISLEPVVAGPENDYALREADVSALAQEYARLADIILEFNARDEKVSFFHFNMPLDGGPCFAKRLYGCGAGVEYLAVDPGGDIYPCHQFVGRPEFVMGNVGKEDDLDEKLVEQFRSSHVLSKGECRECWARFICSGGCRAGAYFANKDIKKPRTMDCLIMKKRIECAIYYQAKQRIQP